MSKFTNLKVKYKRNQWLTKVTNYSKSYDLLIIVTNDRPRWQMTEPCNIWSINDWELSSMWWLLNLNWLTSTSGVRLHLPCWERGPASGLGSLWHRRLVPRRLSPADHIWHMLRNKELTIILSTKNLCKAFSGWLSNPRPFAH